MGKGKTVRKKVLIVDDQAEVRKLVRMALEGSGYEISEAADGAEALAKVHSSSPEIIILDVMMPGEFDGYSVCQRIKAHPEHASAFVVLLTARGQRTDIAMGERAGADSYLVKPFNPFDLVALVERAAVRELAN